MLNLVVEGLTREFVGYGERTPDPKWPNDAKIAVSFVLNFEEGAECCVENGDLRSEVLLSDLGPCETVELGRNLNIESLYEYGSRAGFWRIRDLFVERNVPLTVYACGRALELNPLAGQAMRSAGWEVASHGHRWLNYVDVPEAVESQHIRDAVKSTKFIVGERPYGFYQGKPSLQTLKLIKQEKGFLYYNDNYSDDLPFWNFELHRDRSPLLIIPYTLDVNDMKFVSQNGFDTSSAFFKYAKDAFDVLLAEGQKGRPKMLTIGLHCRIIGRPGRFSGLVKLVEYITSKSDVWITTRVEIARHWYAYHYPPGLPNPLDENCRWDTNN